jgi:hypothetical protein
VQDQQCSCGNYKLHSIAGEQQLNVFLQIQQSKEEAEFVFWQLKNPGNLDSLVNNEKIRT